MALIKCKECGEQVSSKAATCPKCGAKVKKRGLGLGGWIVVLAALGVGVSMLSSNGVSSAGSSAPAPVDPKSEALAGLKITKLDWTKGGFGSVMLLTVTIQNTGKRDVKDIHLECTHYANSDTRIDSNQATVYEVFKAGKSRQIKDFNMGLINSQSAKTACAITDAVLL